VTWLTQIEEPSAKLAYNPTSCNSPFGHPQDIPGTGLETSSKRELEKRSNSYQDSLSRISSESRWLFV